MMRDAYYSDDRRGESTDLRASRELPNRSRPRSPDLPRQDITSRPSGTRDTIELERYDYKRDGPALPLLRDDRKERRQQILPSPAMSRGELSAWELKLEGRSAVLNSQRDSGGNRDGRRSGPRSTASNEDTVGSGGSSRVRDRGRVEAVLPKSPLGREKVARQRRVIVEPPGIEENLRRAEEETTSPRLMSDRSREARRKGDRLTTSTTRTGDHDRGSVDVTSAGFFPTDARGSQNRSKYTDRENSGLDAEAARRRQRQIELDDWKAKALIDVKTCANELSATLKTKLTEAISGKQASPKSARSGRAVGIKGWGEVCKWNNSDGQHHFRDYRHEFVKATEAMMSDVVDSTYLTYLKDPSRDLPSSEMSIEADMKSEYDGRHGATVLPKASFTIAGGKERPGPKCKPKYFRKRGIWSS